MALEIAKLNLPIDSKDFILNHKLKKMNLNVSMLIFTPIPMVFF